MDEERKAELSSDQRAESAWCAAGRPYVVFTTLDKSEKSKLASLVDATGLPKEGFSTGLQKFLAGYYDKRKSTSDETDKVTEGK